MRHLLPAALVCLIFTSPAHAETALEKGFDGALRGCEEWILNPASWTKGVAPFVKSVGLGEQMGLVRQVDEVTLPPAEFRQANHYWRINSTPNAGFVLVVSDQIPMCHITGGGGTDLQPSIETVLASPAFNERWQLDSSKFNGDMATSAFRSRQSPKLSVMISRAKKPGQRLDRVQVIATAIYQISD